MKKRYKIIISIFPILIIIAIALFLTFQEPSQEKNSETGRTNTGSSKAQTIPINYSNLEEELSKTGLIKAIPEKSEILLKFYNFNSGEREIEKSYILRSDGIVLGTIEAPKVILLLHSKYLNELNNKNFCSILSKANSNKDLGIETELSSVKLAWEFRSMKDYKDCVL